jgi:hypothetical protein
MRRPLDFGSIVGILALLASFVLALPGVKAVRAEDSQAPLVSGDGPQCHSVAPEAQVAQGAASMQQLQARLAAQIAAQGGPGEGTPVILNTRGYNYAPGSDTDRIAAEAERVRSER